MADRSGTDAKFAAFIRLKGMRVRFFNPEATLGGRSHAGGHCRQGDPGVRPVVGFGGAPVLRHLWRWGWMLFRGSPFVFNVGGHS